MPRPINALCLNQLTLAPKGAGPRTSGHEIFSASFINETGQVIKGFYKPLSETYPALLAKYVVAVSVALRALIGERAAEDRLVFDAQDNLVGSMSLEIPQYRPFLCFGEAPPQEMYDNELVNPRTSTLLQYNFAEILVAGWIYKCDDRHPGNNSLFGMIDWDMCLYPITHIMKGKRIGVDGVLKDMPEKAFRLTSKALDNFPVIDGPTHWPTHRFPWNCNIAKRYAAVEAIIELARNPSCSASSRSVSFHEQMFTALLKALIVFSPDLLKARLTTYLGEIPLCYQDLESDKATALYQAYPHFFNPEVNDKSFVSHFIKVMRQEYDELYRAVVFYQGCQQNNHGISVPSFNFFMRSKPSAYQAVLTYAQAQNKIFEQKNDLMSRSSQSSSSASSVADTLKEAVMYHASTYSLEAIEKRYHQVWRDSYLLQIKGLVYQFKDVLLTLQQEINHAAEAEAERPEADGVTDFTDAWQLLASIRMPDHLETMDRGGGCVMHQAYQSIFALMCDFKKITDLYFLTKCEALTLALNHDFVSQLTQIIKQYEFEIFSCLKDKSINAEMAKIITNLELLAGQMNLIRHLRSDDKTMLVEQACQSTTVLHVDHADPQVIQCCLRELFNWALTVEKDLLDNCIATVIDEDYGQGRGRDLPVKLYLKHSTEHGADKLAHILSEGGLQATSLNSKLLSRLIPIMLDSLNDKTDWYLLAVRQAFDENRFNVLVYAKAAMVYAQQNERFTHIYAKSTVHRLCALICRWIDTLTRAQMSAYYHEAYKGYSSNSWLFSFMSNRRDLKAEEYLSQKDWSNLQVLLKTFSEGETKITSLNTLIFIQLVDKMREYFQENPEHQEPDSLILTRLTRELYTYYASGLKEFALTRLLSEEPCEVLHAQPS